MKKAGLFIYSFYLWLVFLLTSTAYLLPAALLRILTGWFDKRLLLLHLFSCFWGSCYIWLNPLWRVRISGRGKIPWRRPCVIVSNHQSMADIVVLYNLFVPYKWVSKTENYRLPFVGWLMRLNRYLEVDRRDPDSLDKLNRDAAYHVSRGSSILIFPEGTRYPGGSLGRFMEGAFRIALENKVDIVPVVLDGTAKALPKKGAVLTGFANIRARVLDIIPYESFKEKTIPELKTEVREEMLREYEILSRN
jgi:1-acyl-sn-glycerol-3-phosphate acyltransferase